MSQPVKIRAPWSSSRPRRRDPARPARALVAIPVAAAIILIINGARAAADSGKRQSAARPTPRQRQRRRVEPPHDLSSTTETCASPPTGASRRARRSPRCSARPLRSARPPQRAQEIIVLRHERDDRDLGIGPRRELLARGAPQRRQQDRPSAPQCLPCLSSTSVPKDQPSSQGWGSPLAHEGHRRLGGRAAPARRRRTSPRTCRGGSRCREDRRAPRSRRARAARAARMTCESANPPAVSSGCSVTRSPPRPETGVASSATTQPVGRAQRDRLGRGQHHRAADLHAHRRTAQHGVPVRCPRSTASPAPVRAPHRDVGGPREDRRPQPGQGSP